MSGFDHEQCRVGFSGERFDLFAVAAQTPFNNTC